MTVRLALGMSLIAIAGISACSGPIGEEFQDVDAIGMSRTWNDWVVVGRFGPEGPVKLTDFKECDFSEPCSYSHRGTGHTHANF